MKITLNIDEGIAEVIRKRFLESNGEDVNIQDLDGCTLKLCYDDAEEMEVRLTIKDCEHPLSSYFGMILNGNF